MRPPPSTLGKEWTINPFMRPDSPDLQHTIGLEGASLVDVFAESRKRRTISEGVPLAV